MTTHRRLESATICFGLDRNTDERSLTLFLEKFSSPEFLSILLPRLEDEEISGLADRLFSLLRRHLDHREYHRYFLSD